MQSLASHRLVLALSSLAPLAFASSAAAQCSYLNQAANVASLPLTGLIRSIAMGDLDGDGQEELILSNWRSPAIGQYELGVMSSNLDGSFSLMTSVTLPSGLRPRYVECADFNNDGFADVALAAWLGSTGPGSTLSIYLSDGTGNLILTETEAANRPWSISTGHANGDRNVDVVTFDLDTDTVSVFLGDGNGGLSLSDTLQLEQTLPATGISPLFGRLSDANGDGLTDLLILSAGDPFSGDLLGVSLGDGSGTFGPVAQSRIGFDVWAGFFPHDIDVGDFNEDGITDLAVPRDDRFAVLLSDGSGGFDPLSFHYPGHARSIRAAHIDQNGVLDLWIAGWQDGLYHAFGSGNGLFNQRRWVDLGSFTAYGMRTSDINADGAGDLVLTAGANELRSWLGTCVPYQGHTDEVVIESRVNEAGLPTDPLKPLRTGQALELSVVTQNPARLGSFFGLIAQAVPSPPASLGNRIHIDLTAGYSLALLGQLTTPAPSVAWTMPPGMEDQTIMAQAFVLAPASSGGFETTDAHAFELLR